jgi:uncharacterized protein (TIGR02001 family)
MGRAAFGDRRLLAMVLVMAGGTARAEEAEKWRAPLGGTFNANFSVMSEYSYAGISNTGRQPAVQMGLDYRSPDLLSDPRLWLYLTTIGNNVVTPAGPGTEIDVTGGVKFRPTKQSRVDLGYIRSSFPGFDANLGYNYGDFTAALDYDFGPVALNAKLRFSPDGFASSGWNWNKRVLVSAPLDFLQLTDKAKFRAYGSVGHYAIERYLQFGLPNPEYWYWQFGFVTSALGLDVTVAYTGTNLNAASCGDTSYCDGRLLVSLTKAF